jgi:predicted Ser/Thr protein kinase|tara:strand:+ start:2011 stop:2241 length:231 start_codon:yes stop_codon:yes gene_type:complete
MLTFKESFNEVIEAKLKLPKGEKVAKELTKLGKKKNVTAVITSKFNLYIDGVKLDKYKDQASAEKAVKEFIKLMGA